MTHIRFEDVDDDAMDAEPSLPPAHGLPAAPYPNIVLPPPPAASGQPLLPHTCCRVLVDYNTADPAYVFRLVVDPAAQTLAASTSANVVKLYKLQEDVTASGSRRPGLTHLGNFQGHTERITGLELGLDQPAMLYTSSVDGTVRVWDTRSGQQAQSFTASGQELQCIGVQETLVAAGGQGEVFFWDRRVGKPLAHLDDTHMEEVTQVRFCPHSTRHVVTASLDGLVAVHDTSHPLTHDDAFVAAINVDTSVEEVGFYGPHSSRLWVRTGTETLHLWEWGRTAKGDETDAGGEGAFAAFDDARGACAAAAGAVGGAAAAAFCGEEGVGYLAGCHYDEASGQLLLGAGQEGTLGLWRVSEQAGPTGAMIGATIAEPAMVLQGAHTAVVRSFVCGGQMGGGVCCATGGEDAQICLWTLDPSLVMDSGQHTAQSSGRGRGRGRGRRDAGDVEEGAGQRGGRGGGKGRGRGRDGSAHGAGSHTHTQGHQRHSPY